MPGLAACAINQRQLPHGPEEFQIPSLGTHAWEDHHAAGQADPNHDLDIIDLTCDAAMPMKQEVMTCAHDRYASCHLSEHLSHVLGMFECAL